LLYKEAKLLDDAIFQINSVWTGNTVDDFLKVREITSNIIQSRIKSLICDLER